jgi:hypothetical protein
MASDGGSRGILGSDDGFGNGTSENQSCRGVKLGEVDAVTVTGAGVLCQLGRPIVEQLCTDNLRSRTSVARRRRMKSVSMEMMKGAMLVTRLRARYNLEDHPVSDWTVTVIWGEKPLSAMNSKK